jgi:hypothetical protein
MFLAVSDIISSEPDGRRITGESWRHSRRRMGSHNMRCCPRRSYVVADSIQNE